MYRRGGLHLVPAYSENKTAVEEPDFHPQQVKVRVNYEAVLMSLKVFVNYSGMELDFCPSFWNLLLMWVNAEGIHE